MSDSWYLVKYIPDLWRNEPTNIGVVALRGSDWAAKFLGQRPDGTIDGRRLSRGVPRATYQEWVRFIEKAAKQGTLDRQVDRLARRQGDSFLVERRGPVLAGSQDRLTAIVDDLFVSLVDQPDSPVAASVEEAADALTRSLDTPLERDVVMTVRDHHVVHEVRFDYRYTNGKTTLIERMRLGGQGLQIERGVNELLWRIGLAEKEKVRDFMVLYVNPYQDDNADREKQLKRLEAYANTVDLSEPSSFEHVAQMLDVGLVPDWEIRAALSL